MMILKKSKKKNNVAKEMGLVYPYPRPVITYGPIFVKSFILHVFGFLYSEIL